MSQTQAGRALSRLLLSLGLMLMVTAPALADPAVTPASNTNAAQNSLAFNGRITNTVEAPTLATAKAAFDRREFLVALKQFDKLHSQGMCNDVVHYYMARCYQQNSQVAAALQNYQAVIAKSKNETLRSYAMIGYEQLSKYSHHRTYQGNGNYFQGSRPGPASRGGRGWGGAGGSGGC